MAPSQTIQTLTKRDGSLQEFEPIRIERAIEKAFISANINDLNTVQELTVKVVNLCKERLNIKQVTVEDIQDIVEETLMVSGYHKVARNYILYREAHKEKRKQEVREKIEHKQLEVRVGDHATVIFNAAIIEDRLRQLASDLSKVSIIEMVEAVTSQVYDKIPQKEIDALVLSSARDRIEKHYEYSSLASRIMVNELYKRVLGDRMNSSTLNTIYRANFKAYLQQGVSYDMLHPGLLEFDLEALSQALQPDRDKLFHYLGAQIVSDRYLLRDRTPEKYVFELPQWFWMRVAMGLSLKETNKTHWAIQFYNTLSQMDLVSSTPTLFNSGTLHSQMSSCYLNVAYDSLDSIFKLYSDNAQLSKWAGGIGTDWTYIRATGSKIKGTNGESQGVVPFLKIFNDVALAVNQGGKRKGAMCAYMEIWHRDYEQFLELKKNTGDERRRAHDINTASWIPDLFMKRVKNNGVWTLFCPSDTPDLHDLYGKAFEKRYQEYEAQNLPTAKTLQAADLWRKMLTMLYETGHPWVTFKDPCNVRSPQDHVGVVHSSNLCTEITLNTSQTETAVCNLASINLSNMMVNGQLDAAKIKQTVSVGIRMLDNVIDNNYYPTAEAETANLRHRAVGLGLMGYQDAVYKQDIAFDSRENMHFSDLSMEMVSYYAILASSELAAERGVYETFKGSKWDRNILPLDSLDLLEQERGEPIQVNRDARLDWSVVRESIKKHGIRNSNIMAIAPTATIANISGVYPCTEPAFRNIYMKENLSGSFVVINRYLLDDLESLGIWNEDLLGKIKLNDGSIQLIDEIPQRLKDKYKETFEIDMRWIVESSALRAKWIDQSASTNIFMATKSGRELSETYMRAWEMGLKTTYYLRSLGASQVTKATISEASRGEPVQEAASIVMMNVHSETRASVVEVECEACQ